MKIDLWHGDCLELMKKIPDGSVDLVVTSPPYDNLRTYNGTLNWSFEIFSKIAKELTRVLKKGGVIVWVVGDATIKGSETGNSLRQALYFKDQCYLNLHDTMIYKKRNVVPLTHKRYEQAFEYMFVFCKGKLNKFNGIKDKPNKYFGKYFHGTQYLQDKTKRVSNHNKAVIAEYGLRHNVFEYKNQGDKRIKHPAKFPYELAKDHILSWSNEGDLVLDSFLGSGTTGVAAKNLNRNFIGIELDENYFKIACERIDNA
jgi:site-specific DNA-methyltransferase (adenine-specific)